MTEESKSAAGDTGGVTISDAAIVKIVLQALKDIDRASGPRRRLRRHPLEPHRRQGSVGRHRRRPRGEHQHGRPDREIHVQSQSATRSQRRRLARRAISRSTCGRGLTGAHSQASRGRHPVYERETLLTPSDAAPLSTPLRRPHREAGRPPGRRLRAPARRRPHASALRHAPRGGGLRLRVHAFRLPRPADDHGWQALLFAGLAAACVVLLALVLDDAATSLAGA